MPIFRVLCRVDAFVDYIAEIEADDPQEAAWYADLATDLKWEEQGVVEFDARLYVTLDGNDEPIESTQCGDF